MGSGVLALVLAGCSTGESAAQETVQETAASDGSASDSAHPAADAPAEGEMRVTLLGTGSPVPSTERYGMSTLVQANGLNLVFDAGRGATVRLTQAGVPVGQVDAVFLTHFHSDHINGLSDLWMSSYVPALGGREGAFQLYGPVGVRNIGDGMQSTYRNDIDVRVADKEVDPATTPIESHEFAEDGVVFDQDGVTVTMFTVEHDPVGAIQPAVGYRVDYAGKSVLLSGDTVPTENVLKFGEGVDVLVHEVADFEDPSALPSVYAHHTNPQQAGDIFEQTQPKMAVYSHIVNGIPGRVPGISDEMLVERTRENYDGPLTVGTDLMTFLITGDEVRVDS
ncbi:ribonuclease Z [Rhodococcus pyridinivorans SB3094]|uniref:Ribonuclease Z n=1 Tax=Rhodococcus pyridinivorans SB3094 TaxID=1435356 RepID=V9XGM3_9NOCA|nr:ribonuclease Z [Rhodococcus pyridinivorans SB3094]AHD21892.1 ribonuclease Z [Rhodococcus pyridinivorans SB3094]